MNSANLASPWWAAITVWVVVNAANLLQSAGFVSRIMTRSMSVNRMLGYGIIALAAPAALAMWGFARAGAGALSLLGPALFLAFATLSIVVDYARPIGFRNPPRYVVLVPYLTLFFLAILVMGLPMFRIQPSLWFVTVATTVLLLVAMVAAMRTGVG